MRIKKRISPRLLKELTVITVSFFLIGGGGFLIWIGTIKTPNLDTFDERIVSQSTKIYDKTGATLLYDLSKDTRRTIVPYDQISRNIKNATVAIEDALFWEHRGIRPLSVLRAVLANLKTGSFGQGGSTITQQVVKNTLLTKDKTISRKMKEWWLSVQLEKKYTKEEILASYLNESPYGGSIYGAEEASQSYFGKPASEVTLAEAAYLAALPQAPTFYSPYGNHKAALEARKNLVLDKMAHNNFITKEEYDSAKAEEVNFLPQTESGIRAPHFVFYVKELLEEKYGAAALQGAGYKVITTLDTELQDKAEQVVKKFSPDNKKNFNASNASMVAIDVQTGAILVMVGSRDYFDEEIDGNFNVALAHRQPGSSFKPFVYATAFERGYTPETVVFDLQTEFSTACNPDGTPIVPGKDNECYMPENFDGKYLGPISLRNALAESRNIPAIKTLYLAGIRNALATARNMGITSLASESRYGLTLVLGGGEVSLLELVSAYSGFAGDGVRTPHKAIDKILDSSGQTVWVDQTSPERVLSENAARQINDILSDEEARAPEFGYGSALYFGNHSVADKTGTTNDYRDAWIIGYTPSVAVGAWAGNNDNSPMEKKIAGFIVAPMWHAFMAEVIKTLPPDEHFVQPELSDNQNLKPILRGIWQGNQVYSIDKISGKLATEYTPKETRIDKVITDVHSILYSVDKKDPRGGIPEHPEDDPQFNLWEYAVLKWAKENNLGNEAGSVIPTAKDDIHGPELAPKITITNPKQGSVYKTSDRIQVSVSSTGKSALQKIDVFFNNRFVGSGLGDNPSLSFTPDSLEELKNKNILKVVGYDGVFNSSSASIELNLDLQ